MPPKTSTTDKKSENTPAGRDFQDEDSSSSSKTPPVAPMATLQVQANILPNIPAGRPILPPLSQLYPRSASQTPSSPSSARFQSPYGPSSGRGSPATQVPASPYARTGPEPTELQSYQSSPLRSYGASALPPASDPNTVASNPNFGRSHNPLKRSLEATPAGTIRSSTGDSVRTGAIPDAVLPILSANPQHQTRARPSPYSQGSFENPSRSDPRRCYLHIRQQPRAARAGPDGKDRRSIDPPPIIQLLMSDFDPRSEADLADMRSAFWVVHCRLVTPQSPKKDLSTLSSVAEDGSREVHRLLLGTAVASPFICNDDPDPETMPMYAIPKTRRSGPPSPSSRFFPRSNTSESEKGKEKALDPTQYLCTFFIFADLSIRKAGEYRLEFSLMKIEASMLSSGSTLAIIHSVTSEKFRVVNAKDFDQVQPSTNLVKGLLDRGAGFPLKLKKGTREGQRNRRQRSGDDDDNTDEGEEEDDDDG